jgi:murein DD-endopeptidase MepM/ murein hydrolase activator NlpD
MRKLVLLLSIIITLLSSCTSGNRFITPQERIRATKGLESQLSNKLTREYSLLAIKYDLLDSYNKQNKDMCYASSLFADLYGKHLTKDEFYQLRGHVKTHYIKSKLDKESLTSAAQNRLAKLKGLLSHAQIKSLLAFSKQKESNKALDKLLVADRALSKLPLLMPIQSAKLTSPFGIRGTKFKTRQHNGIDLMSFSDAEIIATADGTITFAGSKRGYGNIISIRHNDNLITNYAHLSQILVRVNQKVKAGQVIGTQGKSGRATNDHLHYEILHQGKHINPMTWIKIGCSTR